MSGDGIERMIVRFPDGRLGAVATQDITEDLVVIGPDATPGSSEVYAERNVSEMAPASEKRSKREIEEAERRAAEEAAASAAMQEALNSGSDTPQIIVDVVDKTKK